MISIVNYGIGNIGSVSNMLAHIGVKSSLASSIDEIEQADVLLLPGVGNFGLAMQTLNKLGFVDPIRRKVLEERKPILGICLGMQLLSRASEEAEGVPGFGFIDADFVKFRPANAALKVPHMGWNTVSVRSPNPLLPQDGDEQRFYFVHSYYARCNNPSEVVATSVYDGEFVCAYGRDNVWGVQFHPEKSHKFGMKLLRNFAAYAC